jgi:Zn-dependent protease with chaperone function
MTHPRARRTADTLGLVLLVIEGHVYLLASILFFIGPIAFLAWGLLARQPVVALLAVFVGLPLLGLTFAAIRSLLFRFPEPYGIEVTARDAPALSALIEDIRQSLGSPRIDRTIIDDAFNAGVRQVPRVAVFWPRNTLVIGYPLLVSLSPEQLRAVVAHELAHVFRAHGRVAGWLYRTRLSWMRLAATLERRGSVPIFVRWILATYVPRLEARSAAIARDQEFLADRCGAAAAGSRTAADSLVAIEIGAYLLEKEFWPAVFDGIGFEEQPPSPFSRMAAGLALSANDGFRAELLATMLEGSTASHDTHPSLRDRLEALAEVPRVPGRPDRTAGEVYVGSRLHAIAGQLDDEWQRNYCDTWRKRHVEIRGAHRRLAELDAQATLTAEETFERATILEKLGRDAEALATYHAAAAMDNHHARAALAAGRTLLARGDDAGAALVERSMELDNSLVPEACALLVRHCHTRNRFAEAKRYEARATRHATQTAIAVSERNTPTGLDRLAPHDMAHGELEPLIAALRHERNVLAALLACKHVRHSSGSLLVLGLITDGSETNGLVGRLCAAGLLPSDAQVVVLDRDQPLLQRALEAVEGSRFYVRAATAV